MNASGKTGKTAGRPTPPLTCGFTEAREDREDGRRTLHSASGAAAPVFPSSLGLMGEDGKTETVARTHVLGRTVNTDPVQSQSRLTIDPTPPETLASAFAYLVRRDALDLAAMLGLDGVDT